MSSVIKVEHLSKRYIIGHEQRPQYSTLRDTLADRSKDIGRRLLDTFFGNKENKPDSRHEEFWALDDVNFDIHQGERIGIIGHNGAGKSTLLKILSRITEPTSGRVSIRGRVASLLEVGTGFHPELTGRENIYLNAAILGMSKVEIRKRFDAIVAFAEVEKFLDTPVKRYSSGMYVRLAFSVAAHLEPEILIVDEVLAVGDFQFQKKCLGRMGELTEGGRTVLFVSHNMSAIRRLSDRVFMLANGKIVKEGEPEEVVQYYHTSNKTESSRIDFELDAEKEYGQLLSVAILDKNGNNPGALDVQSAHRVEIEYVVYKELPDNRVYIVVSSDNGEHIFTSTSTDGATGACPVKPGRYRAFVELPAVFLNSGRYMLGAGFGRPKVHSVDYRENALLFQVEGYPFAIHEARQGYVCGKLDWYLEQVERSVPR